MRKNLQTTPAQRQALVCRLQALEAARQQLAILDETVALLPPADKLILQKLILCPQRGNVSLLAELLEVEPVTLYRRRASLLDRLSRTLEIEN